MAEQLLNGLQVAVGGVEHTLARGVPRLVHPLTRGLPHGHDAAPSEAAIPPVVQAVNAHRLIAVLDPLDPIRRQLLLLALL